MSSNTGHGKHGEAAILQLLGLDGSLLSRVRGVPAERIEAVLTSLDVCSEGGGAVQASGLGARLPEVEDGVSLDEGAAEDPELRGG